MVYTELETIDWEDEEDIYNENRTLEMLDDDEIDSSEAGFMFGYAGG